MESKYYDTVGYACSYVPTEIILAADLKPARIIPGGDTGLSDARIHPNTCCHVKAILSDLMQGAFSGLRGMVFANSCDAMRKLFDIWTAFDGSPPALLLDIPKKKDPDSIAFFASELRKASSLLERDFNGSPASRESLNKAISECNLLRSAMKVAFAMLAAPEPPVRSTEVFDIIRETGHASALRLALAMRERKDGPTENNARPRVVLSGTMLNSTAAVSMMESSGARIVAFDICFGSRHCEGLAREDAGDPFAAVAERTLNRPPCPRMEGEGDQAEIILDLAAGSRADAVIMSHVKYCDHALYTLPLVIDALRAASIPALVLENDYAWSDMEKARIKIETFLDTM